MRFSDMILLQTGVFQLERGHGQWNPDQCQTVVILFAGSETELTPRRFEDDDQVFLPSSLEDCHLRTAEVHHQGWYAEPALERVEELAPAILNFLPEMLIGQKVMILDTDRHKPEGKIYVVKLISVHAEPRIKLSPSEQIPFNVGREPKPHTETDWAMLTAKWTRGIWQEIMDRFESISVQEGISHSNTSVSASSGSGPSNPVLQTPATKRLESVQNPYPNILGAVQRSTREATVIHNHFGATHTTTFHPHSLVLAGNQQTPNSHSERSTTPQPSLCSILTTRHLDGTKSRKILIHHPEIDHRVCDHLKDREQIELWNVAHALRDLRREYLASSAPLIQCIESILKDVDKSIYSEIEDAAEHRVPVPDGQSAITTEENPRIFYSIIMLSYGAAATISRNGVSHSAHLEDMLLCSRDVVTLVFEYVKKADSDHHIKDSYHQIKVSDLSRLSEYGIELDLKPFSNLLPRFDAQNQHHSHNHLPHPVQNHNFEMGKCARGFGYVADQRQESPANTLYGCTFMECFEKFGSQFDWKKHENSAHPQKECWKCALCPSSTSNHGNRASRCESEDVSGQTQTQLFYRKAVFMTHLRSIHFADDDTVDLEIKQRRIGRNCQSRFWCGFCGEIVVLQKKALEGANERFDHITEHFQHGQRIEGWNEMDGSGVKGKEQRDGNGNDASESKGKHTSTASPVAPSAQSDCDTALRVRHDHRLKVDSRDTSCDTGVLHKINKTEKALEESVVDEDDWDIVTLV